MYPKLLPIPVGEENLAIPRAKIEIKKPTAVPAKKKRGKKKHIEVNINEEYVKTLHQDNDNLKKLNDELREEYEKQMRALKEGRVSREEQMLQDRLSRTLYNKYNE